MGNFDLNATVEFEGALDNIEDAITRGIRDSASDLAEIGEKAAQQDLRESGAVYNRETMEGFTSSYVQRMDGSLTLRIVNMAPHSAYVDRGVSGIHVRRPTPHSYSNRKPPLPPIIEWVESELTGWTVNSAGTGLVPADD
ncbi:HK97 gp10-like protein [Halorubrum tailed virus 27]|uniref:HK97 gp10-like protein n=1 Tax=Halorubrum tailed virus 27 TaxID=2878008 RepID=A0AAE8XZ20_9CAUD|nr:HK97 gp10-like protein [Halorubrum tailed virus 27]UBF22709.1 HK97 gp10-like protein [Halorubrum tailed virus 27]